MRAASGGAAGMEEFNRKLESMKQKLATPRCKPVCGTCSMGRSRALTLSSRRGNFVNQRLQMGEVIGRVFSAAGQLDWDVCGRALEDFR